MCATFPIVKWAILKFHEKGGPINPPQKMGPHLWRPVASKLLRNRENHFEGARREFRELQNRHLWKFLWGCQKWGFLAKNWLKMDFFVFFFVFGWLWTPSLYFQTLLLLTPLKGIHWACLLWIWSKSTALFFFKLPKTAKNRVFSCFSTNWPPSCTAMHFSRWHN